MPNDKATFERATFTATLALLARKGVTYGTVIDLGCADGHFYVQHYAYGLLKGSVPLNIDANSVYEPSLKAVQDALGGHYRIAAVSDKPGEIALDTSIHPYWGSQHSRSDPYWQRINGLTGDVRMVPAVRLDDLATELGLRPPYLLKLDIQGAEVDALRGAREVLKQTSVVICETEMVDFQASNSALLEAGFTLFDVTEFSYATDQTLGFFYPVYLNANLGHLLPRALWGEADNHAMIKRQIDRRNKILAELANVLTRLRAARGPSQ